MGFSIIDSSKFSLLGALLPILRRLRAPRLLDCLALAPSSRQIAPKLTLSLLACHAFVLAKTFGSRYGSQDLVFVNVWGCLGRPQRRHVRLKNFVGNFGSFFLS